MSPVDTIMQPIEQHVNKLFVPESSANWRAGEPPALAAHSRRDIRSGGEVGYVLLPTASTRKYAEQTKARLGARGLKGEAAKRREKLRFLTRESLQMRNLLSKYAEAVLADIVRKMKEREARERDEGSDEEDDDDE